MLVAGPSCRRFAFVKSVAVAESCSRLASGLGTSSCPGIVQCEPELTDFVAAERGIAASACTAVITSRCSFL